MCPPEWVEPLGVRAPRPARARATPDALRARAFPPGPTGCEPGGNDLRAHGTALGAAARAANKEPGQAAQCTTAFLQDDRSDWALGRNDHFQSHTMAAARGRNPVAPAAGKPEPDSPLDVPLAMPVPGLPAVPL